MDLENLSSLPPKQRFSKIAVEGLIFNFLIFNKRAGRASKGLHFLSKYHFEIQLLRGPKFERYTFFLWRFHWGSVGGPGVGDSVLFCTPLTHL